MNRIFFVSMTFCGRNRKLSAKIPRSAGHAFAFGKAWSSTIIDLPMKINNLYLVVAGIAKKRYIYK